MTAFSMSSIGITKEVALFGDSKGTYALVRKFFYYAHLPSVEGVRAIVELDV
jgi:hypothetical protein